MSEPRTTRCRCGYQFGQDIDAVRTLLIEQRRVQRVRLTGLAAALVVAIGVTVAMAMRGIIGIPVLLIVSTLGMTGLTARKLSDTNESLRQLPAPADRLPKATLQPPR